jgi:hypothetical protein
LVESVFALNAHNLPHFRDTRVVTPITSDYFWGITFGDPDVWPVGPIADQRSAHWILKNVVGFIAERFFVTEAVFEKILLPRGSKVTRGPPFPGADGASEIAGATRQQMNMVWHDQGEANPPFSVEMIVLDGLKEPWCDRKQRSARAIPTADGEEIGLARGVDPKQDLVR